MFERLKAIVSPQQNPAIALAGPGALKRIANTPLLVTPDTARLYLSYVMKRHGYRGTYSDGTAIAADTDSFSGSMSAATSDLRYRRASGQTFHVINGIAVIPVDGVLAHKYGTLDPYCGMTGYDGIERKLKDAMADASVRGVLLDIDSNGGECAGCQGLAELIQRLRDTKPIWGIVDESAYSAAYWLGASCSRLYMTPSAGVGSIGTVMQHADFSQNLADDGIKVTLIHAGAHKVDGNPYEPLPVDVRDVFAARCEELRQMFAQSVAQGRGISVETVLATEARCLYADEALADGFVDGIVPSQNIIQVFLDDLNGTASAPRFQVKAHADEPPAAVDPENEEVPMTTQPTGAAAPAAQTTQPPAGQPAAPAAPEAGAQASAAAAAPSQPTMTAEQAVARIQAIQTLPEAKGREALANHFAFKTSASVDDVKAALTAAPVAAAANGQSPIDAAMASLQQPSLGAGGDAAGQPAPTTAQADLNPTTIMGRFKANETKAAR